ncbi:tyrosine-protein phosphatase [Dysgonomonas macrotermitis]|uniref:Protein-tyrosine phosphatase n=1 Tax=Dysgonomonas macrotermitis TaxID=1346286 RepID=A0A1M4YFI0_9BACT|nr:tyrosine-protein phosphatase [Dysgonomonas macrotermitis]SHF04515.1 protein-tyrosine phosphatase [Dysgonomonas macrotermitis]
MKKVLFFFLVIPFTLQAQLADSTIRVVKMEGAVNFRDVGNYKTLDNKTIVNGKIFRAASIAGLTDKDMQKMEELKVRTVIDFRGTNEAAAAPDKLLPDTDYTLCPAGSDNLPTPEKIADMIKSNDFLMDMYNEKSIQYYGKRYKPLFQKLLTVPDNESLLFHCTGGRDRTGMATALLLYVLNVPMPVIEEDFTASNVYLESANKQMYKPLAEMSGSTVAEIENKMKLRPQHIRQFFSTIKSHYGSVENFLEKECGVGPEDITRLRERYSN